MRISGRAMTAGVVGRPIGHSLSPLLHGAWIEGAQLDATYVPFEPRTEAAFASLVAGLKAAGFRGVNVTLPFKAEALGLADLADPAAKQAGAANLLIFHTDGRTEARNTDGIGLLAAFAEQAAGVDLKAGPVVVLGAGGAARGAAAALKAAGAPELRIVNRTLDRALILAEAFGGRAFSFEQAGEAFAGSIAIINATSAGLSGEASPDWPLERAGRSAAVMDMVYKPLVTPLLGKARALGLATVDGLAMLIGQARPSFEALYARPPPEEVDVRSLLEGALA